MQEFIIDIFVAIVALLLIVIVMFQDSKDDINDAFNGSKSELFKNQKSRGLESVLQKSTWVIGALFFVLAIICTINQF
jgi:preprotein translocase subunit SecG